MIAGLPWTAWLLLVVAIGLGLSVEVTFYRRQRAKRHPPSPEPPDRS